MNRTILLVAGWIAGTLLSMAIAWAAVASVRDQVTDRPSPLARTTIAAIDAPLSTNTVPPPVLVTEPPATTVAVAPTSSITTSVATTAPPDTSVTTTTGEPETTTTTTAPTTTTTTTTSTTTSTTTTTAPPPDEEWEFSTHSLLGGTVRIKSKPGKVRLVAVVPEPGFTPEIEDEGPDRVKVEFESADRESSFEAKWEGDELEITIEEDD